MPQRKRTLEMRADRIEMILDRHKVKAVSMAEPSPPLRALRRCCQRRNQSR